jgi:hypothetical protein
MRASGWWAKAEWSGWGFFSKRNKKFLNLIGRLVGVRDGKIETIRKMAG